MQAMSEFDYKKHNVVQEDIIAEAESLDGSRRVIFKMTVVRGKKSHAMMFIYKRVSGVHVLEDYFVVLANMTEDRHLEARMAVNETGDHVVMLFKDDESPMWTVNRFTAADGRWEMNLLVDFTTVPTVLLSAVKFRFMYETIVHSRSH